jgi:hypothetical protein
MTDATRVRRWGARKSIVNSTVALIMVVAASLSHVIPDQSAAFVVSTVSIHVAAGTAALAPTYIFLADILVHHDTTPAEVKAAVWKRVRAS